MFFKTKLKEYLNQYPYFLDKSEDSNFTNHIRVYNKQRKELLQQCNNLCLSKNILRPLQIQKIQTQAKIAEFYFYIYLTDIQSIKIERYYDDSTSEIIVNENFTEKGNNYYTYNTIVHDDNVIPHPNFLVTVTTFDEYTYKKGYPENDTVQGNEYDHDTNLDVLGKILGVTRYNHISVTESEYPYTLPLYFDGVTEDDYYYMKRITRYIQGFGVTPLPILNFWRDFGVTPSMYNRKRILTSQSGVEYLTDWVYDTDKKLWCHLIDVEDVNKLVDTNNSLISSIKLQLESILNQTTYPKTPTINTLKCNETAIEKGENVTVEGVVTDSNNDPITGVTVKLLIDNMIVYTSTGEAYSTVTNEKGEYTFMYPVLKSFTLSTVVVEDDEHLSSISQNINCTIAPFDSNKFAIKMKNADPTTDFYIIDNKTPNYQKDNTGALTANSVCGGIFKKPFTTSKYWKIIFSLTISTGNRGGIAFGNDKYWVGFWKDVGNLLQNINGVETETPTSTTTIDFSKVPYFVVTYDEDILTLSINNRQITSFEAPGLTAHFGLWKWGGGYTKMWGNFTVTDL